MIDVSTFPDIAAVPSIRRRLRVGILQRGGPVPRWHQEAIDSITRLACVEALFLFRADFNSNPEPHRVSLTYRAWRRVDRRLFGDCDDYDRVDGVDNVNVQDKVTPGGRPFASANLSAIRAAECDVLIDLGGASSYPAQLVSCARHGIWCLAVDGVTGGLSEQALFRRMFARDGAFELAVIARTQQHGVRTVRQSFCPVNARSLVRMQSAALRDGAMLVARALRNLAEAPTEFTTVGTPALGTAAPATNLDTAKFVARWARDAAISRLRRRFVGDNWFIAFRRQGSGQRFRLLKPPRGHFYADPFTVTRDGRDFIFFEDYDKRIAKGVISVVELDAAGNCSQPEVVLDRPYHLSYPFLMEWNGELFLIPESRQNGSIDAYVSNDFPRGWQLRHTLMQGVSAADPTILEHDGKLWLFAAGFGRDLMDNSQNRDLYVFCSDKLSGPWRPHPKNPVVSDVRRARPAGRPFVSDRGLVRPGQDCSFRYGSAVVLSHIQVLSEDEYSEVPVERIGADWLPGALGIHTFNTGPNLEVIDARTASYRLFA